MAGSLDQAKVRIQQTAMNWGVLPTFSEAGMMALAVSETDIMNPALGTFDGDDWSWVTPDPLYTNGDWVIINEIIDAGNYVGTSNRRSSGRGMFMDIGIPKLELIKDPPMEVDNYSIIRDSKGAITINTKDFVTEFGTITVPSTFRANNLEYFTELGVGRTIFEVVEKIRETIGKAKDGQPTPIFDRLEGKIPWIAQPIEGTVPIITKVPGESPGVERGYLLRSEVLLSDVLQRKHVITAAETDTLLEDIFGATP
jgi:hypothetical protein